MRQLPVLLVCLVMVLSSCSITKRHYRKGFHIEWHHQVRTQQVAQEEIFAKTDTLLPFSSGAQVAPPATILQPTPVIAAIEKPVTVDYRTVNKRSFVQAEKKQQREEKVNAPGTNFSPKPGNDDYVDEGYALRRARLSFWLGLSSFLFFFLINVWSLLLSTNAVKAGRQALVANSAKQDPVVQRKARAGIILARISMNLCKLFYLLMGAVCLLLALIYQGFFTTPALAALYVIAAFGLGIFFILHLALRKYFTDPVKV